MSARINTELSSDQQVILNALVALYPHFYNKSLREDEAKRQTLDVVKELYKLVKENF